jgi:uncharacterized membrane protein YqiK
VSSTDWGSIAIWVFGLLFVLLLVLSILKRCFVFIGPVEVGLVRKRIGGHLKSGIIALNGEAGYQADLLEPGWHFLLPFAYVVETFARVEIQADEVGVVFSQVGEPLATGSRSAVYKPELGTFQDTRAFITNGGQQGIQRPVLLQGNYAINPIAFVVVTSRDTFGRLVDPSGGNKGKPTHEDFGLEQDQLKIVNIPQGHVGIVETLDGPSLETDQVAGRIGDFGDIIETENGYRDELRAMTDENELRQALVANAIPLQDIMLGRGSLKMHHSYMDFQAFLDSGGRMGIQYDVLSTGQYTVNPMLVRVNVQPMTSVAQSEVAVIRSAIGLPPQAISGTTFKYGTLTLPGHRGLWVSALPTGFYPLNTAVYTVIRVPTNVITLSWASGSTAAQDLDRFLSPIQGTSKDGFDFTLELQVQVHVPADQAPHLISLVGDMKQLVDAILQPVVGGFFRDELQKRTATQFITERETIGTAATTAITDALHAYYVEVEGVFIQAVNYPEQIAEVLREREIATQSTTTYAQKKAAEDARLNMEAAAGRADAQRDLAKAEIGVDVADFEAQAATKRAEGDASVKTTLATAEATATRATGLAEAAAIEAKGVAQAKGYEAQQTAIGREQTALVAMLEQIARGGIQVTPQVLVTGNNGGATDGLAGLISAQMLKGMAADNTLVPPGSPNGTTTEQATQA